MSFILQFSQVHKKIIFYLTFKNDFYLKKELFTLRKTQITVIVVSSNHRHVKFSEETCL